MSIELLFTLQVIIAVIFLIDIGLEIIGFKLRKNQIAKIDERIKVMNETTDTFQKISDFIVEQLKLEDEEEDDG